MGSLFAPCVLLRCGIFQRSNQHPPPPHAPLHAYQVNHTCSLSHSPLSVSLSVPLAHKLTFIHRFTLSQLALRSVAQASYTAASGAAPLGPRNQRCSADLFCYLPRSLSFSPSLACLCLLSVHSCCRCRFSPLPSPCDHIAGINLRCFSFGRSYLSLFCSVPVMRFLNPPVTSSSSQPRRA